MKAFLKILQVCSRALLNVRGVIMKGFVGLVVFVVCGITRDSCGGKLLFDWF